MIKEYKVVKPIFKYIGGKSWLKEQLSEEVSTILQNAKLETYIEPFAGGLGAFLSIYDVLLNNNIKNVILSDINAHLIDIYKHIQCHRKELIQATLQLEHSFFLSLPENLKDFKQKEAIKEQLLPAQGVFNKIKKEYNIYKLSHTSDMSIEQSARLIFLQKHAFNGVYRENLKGEYNTPFNWSGNTMLDTIEHRINEVYNIFNLFNLDIKNVSYRDIDYHENALYYLDPPYLNESINENKYHKENFNMLEQINLLNKIKGLNFVYSNHYAPLLIDELNKNENIKIRQIARKNTMSASVASRQTDKLELLASNIQMSFFKSVNH